MPQTQQSADGASDVAKFSFNGETKSTLELRELFAQNEELSKLNFKKAEDALKRYIDPNKNNGSITINTYNREIIRNYLLNPSKNQSNLRKVAQYLYYRSQILYRLVNWYAGMWDLRCRNVKPKYDLIKGFDKNALKSYNDTLIWLDRYNLQENLYEIFVNCYLYDTCYFLWFRDDNGAIPIVLPQEYCKITGRFMTGDFAFAINIRGIDRWNKNIIEYIGEPLVSMLEFAKKENVTWVECPGEYGGCMKFNLENINVSIPPFAPIFQTLSGLLDTEDFAALQNELDVFKMIVVPLETIGHNINDWKIDPKLAMEYLDQAVESSNVPKSVSVVPILGKGVDTVDFSNASAEAQVDRVSNSQKNIFATAGGGAVLNANMINSNLALATWLSAETEFAISSLIGQVDGFTNRMLNYDVSNPCEVKHFELSVYTKNDFRSAMLESNQYSYAMRIPLATLYGISELEMLSQLHFEQDLLGLQNIMIHPLQSSYTSSGEVTDDTDPVNGGRPKTDDGELTDSGERTRNQ